MAATCNPSTQEAETWDSPGKAGQLDEEFNDFGVQQEILAEDIKWKAIKEGSQCQLLPYTCTKKLGMPTCTWTYMYKLMYTPPPSNTYTQ